MRTFVYHPSAKVQNNATVYAHVRCENEKGSVYRRHRMCGLCAQPVRSRVGVYVCLHGPGCARVRCENDKGSVSRRHRTFCMCAQPVLLREGVHVCLHGPVCERVWNVLCVRW